MGPWVDEREGMYQVVRVRVPDNAGAVLRVEGDDGTWVDVIDPYAQARYGIMPDWMRPDPAYDEDALRLRPGDEQAADLHPGVRAVVLGADQASTGRRVSLHVELVALPPPGPHRQPEDSPQAAS